MAAAILLFAPGAKAVPYASGIENTGGTISFRLNEPADAVKVFFDGGDTVLDLGALPQGQHSFSLGSAVSYEIQVTKSGAATWTLISDNANPFMQYFHPKGIAVNQNPADLSLFGRIYIANSTNGTVFGTSRTTGKGIYVINADHTDALGMGNVARTGGITFATSVNSPFRIEVGEDNHLYIADFSDANGTIFRTDPDVTFGSGINVLAGSGNTANPTVHTTCNSSPIVKGSLANTNLTVWAIDGQWSTGANRLLRWNIGGGSLPYNAPPVQLGFAGQTTGEVQSDLDIGPDGKIYTSQARTANDIGAIRIFDPTGTTVLWNSRSNSPSGNDLFAGTASIVPRSLKVSPDGRTLAIIRNDTQTWLIGLTNGIPDLTRSNLLNTFSGTSATTASNAREVAWDAAGNLYVCNNSHERLRVWSPGGYTTAITRSDGTFEVIVPPTTVSVAATVATAAESGPVNGVFTLSRAGDLSVPLTVNYLLGGTASNGLDYVSLPGSVTFAAGAATTNIVVVPVDDAISEFIETVILSLLASDDYGTVAPTSATISILDNDAPELVMAVTQPELLEAFSGAKATFEVRRKGSLAAALVANVTYEGTATRGVDFNGPLTVHLPANASSTNFNVTALDDQLYEGVETVIALVTSGSGYAIGEPQSATAFIIDDELPPAPVLFSEKFDSAASAANWVVNRDDGGSDTFAQFGYDYSADGIPEAPSSSGTFSPRRGLKFRVNETWAVLNGLSVSPAGGNFGGDYRLRFDMWLNFAGPLSGGAIGSTEHISAGVGTTGQHAVWPSGNADGVWFTMSSDGDINDLSEVNVDYGIFVRDFLLPPSSGAYAAGTAPDARGNQHPYYSLWGGVAAPAAQLAIRPWQTGVTPVGTMGMAWHTVAVTKLGNEVTFDVDGRRIGSVDTTGVALSTNVFIGYHDWIRTVATNTVVQFGLVDNVRVESLLPQNAPTIVDVRIIGGNVQVDFIAEPADVAASFVLRSAAVVGGPYAPAGAVITQQGTGMFRAERAISGSQQFYRISRE